MGSRGTGSQADVFASMKRAVQSVKVRGGLAADLATDSVEEEGRKAILPNEHVNTDHSLPPPTPTLTDAQGGKFSIRNMSSIFSA